MTKVTLVHTSPKREVVKGDLYPRLNCVEGLGVAYLGAYLEKEGHEVQVISEMDELGKDSFTRIVDSSPDVLGFYAMTSTFPRIIDYARRAKEVMKTRGRNLVTIVGGDHVSSNPLDSLPEGIDFGCKGEGEAVLSGFLQELNSGDFFNVPGLIWKKDAEVQVNQPRQRILSLDNLPFPKRDPELLKVTTVGMLMYPRLKDQVATASVLTARGCPYSCEFCSSKDVWGNSVIYRSPQNVLREIDQLKKTFGTNTLFIPDLTFNASSQRVFELSKAIREANLGISGYVVMRLMSPNGKELVSYEMLNEMRSAGIRKIGFGVESLAGAIQSGRVKKLELDYTKKVFEWCTDLGILTKAFMMIGYPEETEGTLEETTRNLKYILPSEIRVSKLTPFPGTPLYKEVSAQGRLLTTDLSKYDTNNQIIRLDGLSEDQVRSASGNMLRSYYNSQEYKESVRRQITKHPELAGSYSEFFEFLKTRSILR